MGDKKEEDLRKAADAIWEMGKELQASGSQEAADELKNVSTLLHSLAGGAIKKIVGQ